MTIPEIEIRDRLQLEKLEGMYLAPYASKSTQANTTRIIPEMEHPYRTAFQRDRDRIIHSRAFRRLKHKQQVFLISEGDHFRTRLTHTLEVSQLARTMAKSLGLNEDLVEAIALGHDLGHTPFGHTGEFVLNDILSGKDTLNDILPLRNFGGFKHNYQSLRVVDKIEKRYQFDGLNLTAFVREGILKHTKLKRSFYSYPDFFKDGIHFDLDCATTLEGQVVAVCDEIAQRTHDLEDGIRAGFVELEEVRELKIVRIVEEKFSIFHLLNEDRYGYRNALINGLITVLVSDVIKRSYEMIDEFFKKKKRLNYFDEEIVQFSDDLNPKQLKLDAFINNEIIFKASNEKITNKNTNIIRQLFLHYFQNPNQLPEYILNRFSKGKKEIEDLKKQISDGRFVRIVADHIAGMTDRFAELELIRLNEK